MVYSVKRSAQSDLDLENIFRHLIESYLSLGEDLLNAIDLAEAKMNRINLDIQFLARLPHQGTISPHLGESVRHVTKDRAIIYFEIEETRRAVKILAVFFGGHDHRRHMATRMHTEEHDA